MSNLDIKELQALVDEACAKVMESKKKLKELEGEIGISWAPIADSIKAFREEFLKGRTELQASEKDNKEIIGKAQSEIRLLRDDLFLEAGKARDAGDMARVKELTLASADLVLKLQDGIILQNDFDVQVSDLSKIPLDFIFGNPKIMDLLEKELKSAIKADPERHISGIRKVEKTIVKVREGHRKSL